MYVRSLKATNLKLLRSLNLDFRRDGSPRMWTVLIGPNGTCKTTILKAIGMAASGKSRAESLVKNRSSLRDLRRPEQPVTICAAFDFSARFHTSRTYPGLTLEADVPPPTVFSELILEDARADFAEHSGYQQSYGPDSGPAHAPPVVSDARSQQLSLWFAAGYGVNRILPVPMTTKQPEDPALMRMQPLFDQGTIIGTGFKDLFQDDTTMAEAYQRTLDRVLTEGERLLPHVNRVDLNNQKRGVRRAGDLVEAHRLELKVGPTSTLVPTTWLSQGYQSTLAWIADLVGQVLWESGEPIEPEDMEGLVLIDELDLHLHPSWQQVLIPALKASFPAVQFVATTHSPMLLPGLEADEIIRLGHDDEGNVVATTGGQRPALMTGSQLYDYYFNVSRTNYAAELQRYAVLAGNPHRSDDDERELQRLTAKLHNAGIEPGWSPVPRTEASS